ncbi:MAG: hypothetical protein KF862_24290 [Chitinophagaceae bacterium]|nr:hypothetical protein [Chitinophagaceae bacterium]
MKYFITFLLLLASSICLYIFACGPQYPDEVRFSILRPAVLQQKGFENFHYSRHLFQYTHDYEENIKELQVTPLPDENIALWSRYCKGQVSTAEIEEAVYRSDTQSVQSASTQNGMIQYLQKTNNKQAIDYILFAKECEPFNRLFFNPWERDNNGADEQVVPKRNKLIEIALKKATQSLNDIQLRYAFLAIRLAYYNNDPALIKEIYQQYFSKRAQKSIIDYWALYFHTIIQPESVSKNLDIARVYANAPDKRMAVIYEYKKNIAISSTLSLAKNNNDRAAVYLIDGVRNPGRALLNLKNLYLLNAKPEYLDFLLMREINKLEDWLYTPEYYLFPPSISFEPYYEEISYSKIWKNMEQDRVYARQVLQFIDSANAAGTKNKVLWGTAKAYVHLMLKEHNQALTATTALQKVINKEDAAFYQLQMIEALALTARQEKGKAIIPEKIKPLLLTSFQKKNYPFIFAIAKELEYKGNTSDAALLMTKVNQKNEWLPENVYWKNAKGINNKYVDFYWEYFGYLDAQYSAAQLNVLIKNINAGKLNKDRFSEWKYENIQKDMSRLYDLLGTKYIRENNLEAALKAFKNVNDTLWTSARYSYEFYLAANPFYTNMYNEHTPTHADTIRYTKTTITSTLIDYVKKANDPLQADRDYYYFLAANCYLNMTQYGNSWMMRRYYWTSSERTTGIVDDEEYFNCTLAKKYYLEAKKFTKSKKFAALCLRMAGRCEKHKLNHAYEYSFNRDEEKIFKQNGYYRALKTQYPEYYDDLISNCESFENYFASRGRR